MIEVFFVSICIVVMNITKSVFVDYIKFPKLARWRVHDREVYNTIRNISSEEAREQLETQGQMMEDGVRVYLERQYQCNALDLMPDFEKTDNDADESVYFNRELALTSTIDAVRRQEVLLYQPTFRYKGCLVRADLMLWNGSSYDLIEVKAKNHIRKKIKDNKEDKHIGRIEDEFINDLSFQVYVINKVLEEEWLPVLGATKIVHLNADYVKQGDIDWSKLLVFEEVGLVEEIEVIQRWKAIIKRQDNRLMSFEKIESILEKLRNYIALDELSANKHFPRPGNKYLEYFGEERPFWTIMGRGISHNQAHIVSLYQRQQTNIVDLTESEISGFSTKAQHFIRDYLRMKTEDIDLIDSQSLRRVFDELQYPLCFYDYETIHPSIPLLNHTSPYQQAVVQYSLHKYYPDGSMKHFAGILTESGEFDVKKLSRKKDNNTVGFEDEKVVTWQLDHLFRLLIADIGEDIEHSSFIVWNKCFEDKRNQEMINTFPALEQSLRRITDQTYDLMEVFSSGYFKSLAFEGSASIKKVLPALVPDMSYEDMSVGSWDIASQYLYDLIAWLISKPSQRRSIIDDLLRYCGQDTLAMVKIFETLKERIQAE